VGGVIAGEWGIVALALAESAIVGTVLLRRRASDFVC